MHSFRFRLLVQQLLSPAKNRCFSTSISCPVERLTRSHGLPSETAAFIKNKLSISGICSFNKMSPDRHKLQKCDQVLGILKDHGFSGTQIAELIQKRPSTLRTNLETFKGKLQLLSERGFRGMELGSLIVNNPKILARGLESRLEPALDFLKTCLGSEDKVVAVVKRMSWLLSTDLDKTAKPSIDLMVEQGVPLAAVAKLISLRPNAIIQKPERMAYAIKAVRELGVEPSAPMFILVLGVMMSMSEVTLKKKMEVFKSLGWSQEDIRHTLKQNPSCLTLSEEKIRSSWDFFVKEVKCDPSFMVSHPKYLMYALETRVRPRYNVFKALKAKNLVNEKLKFHSVMGRTEKEFIERFIMPNKEQLPDLMNVYCGSDQLCDTDL